MNSIQILKNEHRLIEKVIGVLEGMVRSSRKGEGLSMERLKKILQFTRIFIDRCHHGKEEVCLFPCLEKRGIPREGGPIGVMLQEHEMGRRLVQQIEQNESTKSAQSADRQLLSLCEAYVQLLTQHITKEDHVLFELADRLMTEEDAAQVLQEFDRVEEERVGPGVHDEMHKLSEEILSEESHSID